MAFSPKTLLTLATLLVLATSQAHGLTVDGVNVNALVVNLSLNCPSGVVTGTAGPYANIPVLLLLNNKLSIASATTDVNGNAVLTVNSGTLLAAISNTLSNLKVSINLPIPTCPILATTTGVLQGAVKTVGTVVNNVLTANVPAVTIHAA